MHIRSAIRFDVRPLGYRILFISHFMSISTRIPLSSTFYRSLNNGPLLHRFPPSWTSLLFLHAPPLPPASLSPNSSPHPCLMVYGGRYDGPSYDGPSMHSCFRLLAWVGRSRIWVFRIFWRLEHPSSFAAVHHPHGFLSMSSFFFSSYGSPSTCPSSNPPGYSP